ncbi:MULTISPECIES: hydrogenase subunit MbhD domain-containing protein [Microbacterium]|uniref:hydrogenase subunit MbhD domain-containing protein n=1 Tax=Microbacterium TaxID=33882 RepID=UPI0027849644|nr:MULTISPECIES: hydrogen gas-evolving membrane-bound hydrogenase subunit E [Microbacterium]MDQ1081999.1 multisubunit Na+/H+ antiporter MnhB subunit [Microbacterium sp. SORGH_AS_0344]MDQ1169234.1 multisubunit Na+/H+ antiporter MnhB subunit [Microbacterium proteolyticum]
MSGLDILDTVVVGAVLVTALVAVLVPGRAAAHTAFLVFGILLAVLWGRVDAPDVAIAEAALGGGIAGALLVDALERRTPPPPGSSDGRRTVLAIILGGVAAAALVVIVRRLPPEPAPLAADAFANLDRTGVSNPITAVLLNYRSLDTLLEIAVLVTAAVAVGAVARERIRPVREAEPVRRALALVLVPVLLVLAVWILVAGSRQPGGAFQAGALAAAALVVAHLCGIPYSTPRGRTAMAVAGGGVVAFVLLGVIGLGATGAWLGLDPAWAGAAILAIEAVLAVSIAVALAGVFLGAGAVDVESDEAPV